MLGAGLHRYRDDARYLLIDTETEGLNTAIHRPWQVAWMLATKDKIIGERMAYVRWANLAISQEAAIVSRFDRQVYDAKAEDARAVLTELETLLYDPTVEVVWQGGLRMDAYILTNWRRALGLKTNYSYLPRSIDTDALSKAKIKQWTPDISSPEAWLGWQYQCANYIETGLKTNLTAMAKEEKIDHDYSTVHDALSDVRLMYKVFQKRLWQVEF